MLSLRFNPNVPVHLSPRGFNTQLGTNVAHASHFNSILKISGQLSKVRLLSTSLVCFQEKKGMFSRVQELFRGRKAEEAKEQSFEEEVKSVRDKITKTLTDGVFDWSTFEAQLAATQGVMAKGLSKLAKGFTSIMPNTTGIDASTFKKFSEVCKAMTPADKKGSDHLTQADKQRIANMVFRFTHKNTHLFNKSGQTVDVVNQVLEQFVLSRGLALELYKRRKTGQSLPSTAEDLNKIMKQVMEDHKKGTILKTADQIEDKASKKVPKPNLVDTRPLLSSVDSANESIQDQDKHHNRK